MINAPYRLVSLWDMLKAYSTRFSQLMVRLFDLEMSLFSYTIASDEEKNAHISADDKKSVEICLVVAKSLAEDLALDAVLPLTERMLKNIERDYSNDELYRDIANLRSRINDQLKGKKFLFVAPGRAHYYENAQLFGAAVADKFPKAIDDIEDAGKCLALGQGTASVMHLMRVMEDGLKVLAKQLNIPYAPSWESYLTQIQSKIDAKHKTKGIKWKRDEKFYRDISGDLLTIKQAWRNPTMHIDRRYSPEEAEEIFKAVRILMGKLAEKLTT